MSTNGESFEEYFGDLENELQGECDGKHWIACPCRERELKNLRKVAAAARAYTISPPWDRDGCKLARALKELEGLGK